MPNKDFASRSNPESSSGCGFSCSLEYLYIKANNVSDFSFLKDLSSLKALFIISKVAEFSFEYFENMSQLERIALSGNKDIQRFNLELKLTKNIV